MRNSVSLEEARVFWGGPRELLPLRMTKPQCTRLVNKVTVSFLSRSFSYSDFHCVFIPSAWVLTSQHFCRLPYPPAFSESFRSSRQSEIHKITVFLCWQVFYTILCLFSDQLNTFRQNLFCFNVFKQILDLKIDPVLSVEGTLESI